MLNQVSRALAQLFRPITSAKSDADRDPSGNAYEKFTPPKKEDGQSGAKSDSDHHPEQKTAEAPQEEQPLAQVIPFNKQSPEEVVESRKREIRNSQAWLSLVNLFQDSKTAANPATKDGPDAYEQGAGSKKGVIVDKKAG
jgi:hypothetical protein